MFARSIGYVYHYYMYVQDSCGYRAGTGPQRNCLKEPGKARDAISMQRE